MSRLADLPRIRSPRRMVWAALFAAWGILLSVLLVSGGLARYLAARNRPFAALAAVVMLALSVVEWRRSAVPHKGDPEDVWHEVSCRCRRGETPRSAELTSVALLLVPFLVLAIVPAGTLGASTARSRGVATDLQRAAPNPQRTVPEAGPTGTSPTAEQPFELTILDIVYAVNSPDYADKIDLHPGSHVRLLGLAVKGGQAPSDGFLLARFLVTCCVADAVPIGVRVTGAGAATTADNTWVVVEGTITWSPPPPGLRYASQTLADLAAESIEPAAAPPDPYVY